MLPLLKAATLLSTAVLLAQPQPSPPPQDAHAIERRIEEIRRRLEGSGPLQGKQKELHVFVQRYLREAEQALAAGRLEAARHLADAADDCRRPLDHLQEISSRRKQHPPPPDAGEHLRRVYFRLRMSDALLKQIPAPAPVRLRELAREFYEAAVRAQQAGESLQAGEYAKASDDLTHALENLAQAAGS